MGSPNQPDVHVVGVRRRAQQISYIVRTQIGMTFCVRIRGTAARTHYSGYVGVVIPCHCNLYTRARRNVVCGDPRFTRRMVTASGGAR